MLVQLRYWDASTETAACAFHQQAASIPSQLSKQLDETPADISAPMRALLAPQVTEDSMYTILVVLLVLMLLGALPTWPYSRSWGYYPSGGLGLVLVVIVVLMLLR